MVCEVVDGVYFVILCVFFMVWIEVIFIVSRLVGFVYGWGVLLMFWKWCGGGCGCWNGWKMEVDVCVC